MLGMLYNEKDKLQAIEDLYAIYKAQPEFKDKKEPNWSTDTDPVEVICWLLRKLSHLTKGEDWTVDTYNDNGVKRYCFVTYRPYSSYHIKKEEQYMPLDFLPILELKDPAMHDIVLDAVALVSKRNYIPLWDEDGDFSAALEEFINAEGKGFFSGIKQRQWNVYTTGPAAKYLKLLHKRRRTITAEKLLEKVKPYMENKVVNLENFAACSVSSELSQRKREIIWWASYAIKTSLYGYGMAGFDYSPDYKIKKPISTVRQYKFIWSHHHNDIVHSWAMKKLQKESHNNGNSFPITFTITKPGEVYKRINIDKLPVMLSSFLEYGITHFTCQSYWNYYYKHKVTRGLTREDPVSHAFVPKVKDDASSLMTALELHSIHNHEQDNYQFPFESGDGDHRLQRTG